MGGGQKERQALKECEGWKARRRIFRLHRRRGILRHIVNKSNTDEIARVAYQTKSRYWPNLLWLACWVAQRHHLDVLASDPMQA